MVPDMLADMEVDKVADMVGDMVADMAAYTQKISKRSVLGQSCLMRSVPDLRV